MGLLIHFIWLIFYLLVWGVNIVKVRLMVHQHDSLLNGECGNRSLGTCVSAGGRIVGAGNACICQACLHGLPQDCQVAHHLVMTSHHLQRDVVVDSLLVLRVSPPSLPLCWP